LDRPKTPRARPERTLQFDRALQLLSQSGHPPPAGEPGSVAWQQAMVDALVDLSSRDALTGLANRRAFELAVAREVDRVARSGEPALLLTLDIDHFKRVNDTHGHAAGDQVIRAVGNALVDSVRPMDLVARVGGEEFAIILPNCASTFGQTVAERMRRRVERMPVALVPSNQQIMVTVSVGGEEFAIILPNCASTFGQTVAERMRRRVERMPVALVPSNQQIMVTVSVGGAFAPQWVRSTPALWQERADQQLYLAKAQGRNLVRLEPTAVSVVSNEEKRLLFDSFQLQDHE